MSLLKDKILRKLLATDIDTLTNFTYLESSCNLKKVRLNKISICTTVMNRLGDIQQTFLRNITDNLDYPNVEFLLLDYNSLDGLEDWVHSNFAHLIRNGKVSYYRTQDPKAYSMTHSRNVAFKLAQGDIINNVDADHFINKGFCKKINELANIFNEKAVFVKSKQKNRGRLSFFKNDFVSLLGGYDEGLEGYGFDDQDILLRAVKLGFRVCRYGGDFYKITENHHRHEVTNYEEKDWKYSQRKNTIISLLNLLHGRLKANEGKHWGKANLIKNFSEEICI